ncbi:MAG: DUF1595 domain-containing protein, partial [Gammaproteobacteria bacterium]|nr:DUF1595 domain-containing protein [Gammaproteobacteria bacterium]
MNPVPAALTTLGLLLVLADRPVEPVPAAPIETASVAASATTAAGNPEHAASLTGVIRMYCQVCHNDALMTGNISFQAFEVESAPEMAEIAERMIRKLRAGMMPPQGFPRPAGDTLQALAAELETRVDAAWEQNPNPGFRTFQRLNRAEFASAVEDLLGLQVDVGEFLPLDTRSANFDNIADVQAPSATLMEGYLRAANYISRVAVGDPDAEPNSIRYRLPRTTSQKDRVEGAPFGTRGGVSVIHNFPADGKYVFHIQPYPAVEGEVFGRTFGNEQMEVSLDGQRVALVTIDRWMSESEPTGLNVLTDSIYVRAGPRRVTAAFLKRPEGELDDLIRPIDHTLADGQIGIGYGVTTMPHLQRLSVLGPYEVTGVSDTPTRQLIFSCRPTSPEEARPCARDIVSRLATRAYRRPVDEFDVEGLMAFYDQGADERGFEGGVQLALQAILASPHFLFRMERAPGATAGTPYSIADADLASRLSFFLWGAPPDQPLIAAAERGELSDPDGLLRHARRMPADGRAAARLARRFGAAW